jgi:phage terminase Nu1 subunit (DNA packaging protein)
MKAEDLTQALGVTSAQLTAWIKRGLPCTGKGGGRQFDPQKVRDWLLANGLAKSSQFVPTLDEAAAAIGIHPRTLATWIKQGAPGRTADGYDVGGLQSWRADKDAPDPLMAGTVSPALERYRVARAKLAELELREKRKQWWPADQVIAGLNVFASTMRSAFEALRREHGPEAYKLMDDALSDATAIFERAMGQTPPSV